jgi:kinesin family protein 11
LNAGQETSRLQLEEAKRQIEINDSQLQTTRDQFEQNLRLLGTRESELKELSEMRKRMSSELVTMSKNLSETKGELDAETVVREAFERSRSEWKRAAGDAFGDVDGLRAKLGTSSVAHHATR